MNISLSIIIPIHITKEKLYLYKRLEKNLNFFSNQKTLFHFEIIVSDSSNNFYKENIKKLSSKFKNCKYIYYTLENNIYSAAKARNYGVLNSSFNMILFYDVDLMINDIFIKNLFDDLNQIKQEKKKFFIYPCLYLTENYTKLIENKTDINFNEIKKSYLKGYNDKVLYLAVNTSTILVNKEYFIKIGMYNESFKGHGYEDFELIHRLYINYTNFKIEQDYLEDYKTYFPADYRGFRKYFSYTSLPNFFRDMYTIHLWHPRPLSDKYYKIRKNNQKHFLSSLRNDLKKYKFNNKQLIAYDQFIFSLMKNNNYDETYCGLYGYNQFIKKPKSSIKRKLRKLILHPIDFIKDAIKNLLGT